MAAANRVSIVDLFSCGVFVNVVSNDPASWRRQIEWARGLSGLKHLEVWLEWVPVSRYAQAELGALLADVDVIVHAPFVHLSLVTPWVELRDLSIERLRAAAVFAQGLRASAMTVHAGTAHAWCEREQLLDRVSDAFLQLQDAAGATRLALVVQPGNVT